MYDELKQGASGQPYVVDRNQQSRLAKLADPSEEFLNLDKEPYQPHDGLYSEIVEDCGYSTTGPAFGDWDDDGRASELDEEEQNGQPSITQPFTVTKNSTGSGLTSETISTYDSNKAALKLAGQKKLKYFPLHDEGKVYKYEDDPKLYMRIRKKIQNRESARRVRIKEKDQTVTVQTKVGCLQEENQRLQIENSALKSENAMLRNQVSFMERLLLKGGAGGADGPNGGSGEGLKRRTEPAGGSNYFLQAGVLGVLMVVSYLPEGSSGSAPAGSAFQQRVLAEVTSGFHLFAAKSFSAMLLALIRSGALLYGLVVIIIGISCGIQHHKRGNLTDRLIDDYGQKKDS